MRILVRKEEFAVIKAKKPIKGAFANIIDKKEITSIVNQNNLDKKNIIKLDKDYKIITFDAILDFNLVGFIAKVSKVLAKEKIPLFVVSGYSTDHILIKKKYLKKAIEKLEKLK